MNITPRQMMSPRRQTGFSLIEMIGVLAIIAVLAVIIVPKVFSTIASARITSAASSALAMKSAVVDYASRYGTIHLTSTSNNARLDDALVAEGLLDGRFVVKLGTQPTAATAPVATLNRTTGQWAGGANQRTQSRLICLTSNPAITVPSATPGTNYFLNGGTVGLPAGARVVSAVIAGVTGAEARELSLRIDGDANTPLNAALADNAGKVIYAQPAGAASTTDVYIYLAHQ